MSNICPKCHKEAMPITAKLLKRPQVCMHCGTELRMNLVYTVLLSAIYFLLAVMVLWVEVSSQDMVFVLVITAGFVGSCLFIPFEQKPAKSG